MIRFFVFAILLVVFSFAQAERVFEGEKLVEVFQSQDFDANLAKAEEGDVRAQYLVGAAYLYGLEAQEVEVDHEQGRYWLEKAAGQGAAEAYSELARIYRNGMGVKQDARKYEKYLAEAAERGMSSARLDIKDLYRYGDPEVGVEKNNDKYIYWLRKEAEDNHPYAMRNLAITYRQGLGVEVDFGKSFEWIMKAVALDAPFTHRDAAQHFENGWGTEQDLVKAYMLYDLASPGSSNDRDEVAERMTEEEVAEAIARSWQWQLERNSFAPSSNGYRYQPDVSDLEPLSLTPESDQ
ncbi:tetratricopeptide repeat protein [Halomonas mongoliensis]|uniref:tetratricopeptide repeat protein n=1 Tax=Halomonas mongoliensis TaxID=321265 RepID=UPI00403AD477